MREGMLIRMHSGFEHTSETSFSLFFRLSEMQCCHGFKLPMITTFVKERRQGLPLPLVEAQGCSFVGENGRQSLQRQREFGI